VLGQLVVLRDFSNKNFFQSIFSFFMVGNWVKRGNLKIAKNTRVLPTKKPSEKLHSFMVVTSPKFHRVSFPLCKVIERGTFTQCLDSFFVRFFTIKTVKDFSVNMPN
jgi:hypothetical protein